MVGEVSRSEAHVSSFAAKGWGLEVNVWSLRVNVPGAAVQVLPAQLGWWSIANNAPLREAEATRTKVKLPASEVGSLCSEVKG
ncbi:MAG TPA: hypothetical protein IGS53_08770 [Leptolyngbyaceae cyanobacterium M33_DOE_097]|uniref:Uncharacterized protein n=1 Tax=Oscillatoriales cyanobacterium SpSt-418 TaxID=2282169 RepID=A0A7C3KI17_9CYAN|nr:hypothetical protein [Leptolyngbyaceae cyanobacterium M33_DOE_097]